MGLFDRKRKKTDVTVGPGPDSHMSHSAAVAGGGYAGYAPEPTTQDLTLAQYANGIPNIKIAEIFRGLTRRLLWIIPVLIIGWLAAWVMTADFKRTYSGEATLMVQIGDEYVYQPVAGTAAQGSVLQTPDTITLNEIAIIKSPEVMDTVLGQIITGTEWGSLNEYAPELGMKLSQHAEYTLDYQLAYMELRKKMDKEFFVAARPKSSIIDLSYKHENPQMSVAVLNALLASYDSYRKVVFVEGKSDDIAIRRQETERQLTANEAMQAMFLSRNGVSDFESEQKGAQKRTEDLKATLNTARAQIVELERSLAIVEDQLRQTPPTIDLYVDDRAANRVAQAELELKQLLAKYLPTSDPVRQKQLEINEMRALQRANGGKPQGGRRVGPNTVYQALLTRRNTLQAQANAAREKEFTLQGQLNSVDAKLRKMTAISPEYTGLLRENDTLTARLKAYLTKEQEALITQSQAEGNAENVIEVSRALYPSKGRDMRKLAFAFAAAGWTFTVFMLALFRVFSDPRLYATPPAIRMPVVTPAAPVMPASTIPEPVQPYEPATPMPQEAYPPTPAYAPAAYAPQPGYEGTAAYADPYAQPAAYAEPPYADPNAYPAAPYGEDTSYQANPYLAGASAGSIG